MMSTSRPAACGAPSPAPGQWWRLSLTILLSGVAAGLIGISMAYLLEGFEWLFYGVRDGSLPQRVTEAATWRRVLAPAAGGLVAGSLWWWERATGGVVSVERTVEDTSLDSARRMGILRPFADAVLQVLTVGSGNSVGREGAPRLAAGAVASRVSLALRVDVEWVPVLVASAAGAGLAAMYNAPLGGAAYAVEIVMLASTRAGRGVRAPALAVVISVLATVVSWLHSHGAASLSMPRAPLAGADLLAAVVVIPTAALAGWGARSLWGWFKAHRLPDSWTLPLAIGGAGLLTGTASLWLAELPGNGKDAFQAALTSPATGTALVALAGVIVLKPLLTGVTLGAGATGGLLAPSFALGSSVGAGLAGLAHLAGADVSVAAMAVLGGGVVLAVTQKAPVFAALFIWELPHAPLWLLPVLLIGTTSAVAVTTWLPGRRADARLHRA